MYVLFVYSEVVESCMCCLCIERRWGHVCVVCV